MSEPYGQASVTAFLELKFTKPDLEKVHALVSPD